MEDITLFTETVPSDLTEEEINLNLPLKKFTVTIDKNKELFVSDFTFGITHTHYMWENGDSTAVKNASELISSVSSVNNQHIMGWGADNPWKTKDAPFDFSSVDRRVSLFDGLGGDIWLTLCQAPGWMKGSGDWDMEKSVLDEYIPDFAYLCAEIAKNYPQVTMFQVWNEFKGYWNGAKNEWDYERYTKMYNEVYKEIKKVRPDAKVGGFYLVLEGDGSKKALGRSDTHDYEPLSSFQRRAIKYWLDNSEGADYILIDRGIIDYHNDKLKSTATLEEAMILTKYYAKVTKEIAELTDLPIVYSEYYGADVGAPVNSQYTAAQYASIYYNMIMGSGGRGITALLWMEKEENIKHAIFTDTNKNGGKPTPHYDAVKKLTDNFPPGTVIYNIKITSSEDTSESNISDKIEILASDKCCYAINKTNEDIYIEIDGKINILKAYDVQVFFFE